MKTSEIVKVSDDRVVIGPVTVRWPNLTEKNTQFGPDEDARYTVAIQLDETAAELLRRHMKSIHDAYVGKNPKSADMEIAPFGKDLGNGKVQFELQNRQQKPIIVDSDGIPHKNGIPDRSIVRLVAEPVTYTDNRSNRTGVSLRVRAVELISEPPSDVELLGHSPIAHDNADTHHRDASNDGSWNGPDDDWDDPAQEWEN